MIKNNTITVVLTRLQYACVVFLVATMAIGCNENNVDLAENVISSDTNPAITYDSAYNAKYNLYVVSDDTTAYNINDYNSPLNYSEKRVRNSWNEYASKMLAEYSDAEQENKLVSPMSATMLYSLMANFVDEKMQRNVFKEHIDVEQIETESINSFCRKYLNQKAIEKKKSSNEGIEYNSDLWMDQSSAVYESFLSKSKFYDFGVKGIEMRKGNAVDAINDYISTQMGNDKSSSINKEEIELAKPLVTSSMIFKGEWKDRFNVDTSETNMFANADGSKTVCKMIYKVRGKGWSRFENFDMVEIPYKDTNYSMYVLLPHEESNMSKSLNELNKKSLVNCMDVVSDSLRSFHGEYFSQRDTTTSYGTYTVVDTLLSDTVFSIRIPKFKIRSTTALNPTNGRGTASAKLLYQTNLPKVSPNGFKLSNVFQSCYLEVNEKGTTATSTDSVKVVTEIDLKNTTHTGSSPGFIYTGSGSQGGGATIKPTVPKGKKIYETITVPFHTIRPFAVFIREKGVGSIPFACSVKTLKQ